MELISVIVPIYKVENYLERCIHSIVNQSYTELEIILVDDGSPDKCPVICDRWAEQDERIIVLHKENGGLSDARNAGMQIATGKYFGFVDSDDYIAPRMYEELIKSMHASESDIAACAVQMVWENSDKTQLLTNSYKGTLSTVEAELELIKEDRLKQPVWYKLYKADLVNGIMFEKGRQHEDVFWSYQAIGKAHKISIIDYIGYYYVQRPGSIMNLNYSVKRLDAIDAFRKRLDYMRLHYPTLETKAQESLCDQCVYQGQLALEYLDKKEQRMCISYLNNVYMENKVIFKMNTEYKFSHKIWHFIGNFSFEKECKLRNLLKIGL